MRVVVVGQGYVGLTAATALAADGHEVVGVECDGHRLRALRAAAAPLYEPGLQQLLADVTARGALTFEASVADVDAPVDAVVVAVGSPPSPSGAADLRFVRAAVDDVARLSPLPDVVMVKSTIPPGTSGELVARSPRPAALRSRYVHSPEFLNQGTALEEWRNPARVVVGLWEEALVEPLRDLYRGVTGPWVVTTPVNAEMIKYASNAYLATRISFANELANACERLGADVGEVLLGAGLDPRIGGDWWRPGIGYGDSCLAKDLAALTYTSTAAGCQMRLLEAVQAVNVAQRLKPVRVVRDAIEAAETAAPVAVLGLNNEPHSDDMRYAASLVLVPELRRLGDVRVWDPLLPERDVESLFPGVTRCESVEDAVSGAGVAVVLTEFDDVVRADWPSLAAVMTEPALVVDAKNCLEPAAVMDAGLAYRGVGRSTDRVADRRIVLPPTPV